MAPPHFLLLTKNTSLVFSETTSFSPQTKSSTSKANPNPDKTRQIVITQFPKTAFQNSRNRHPVMSLHGISNQSVIYFCLHIMKK